MYYGNVLISSPCGKKNCGTPVEKIQYNFKNWPNKMCTHYSGVLEVALGPYTEDVDNTDDGDCGVRED